ncbi:MAG: sulfite oxidase [Solirubrobacterales bacterium]|nr:sulfite oxidase [Solirubrobacterales bacterium]
MPLFVVRHGHDPANCPAADPGAGAELLNHLGARRDGLRVHGEAVVRGQHAMVAIVEATDEDRLQEFLAPFAAAGDVEVLAASTCAGVIVRGGCVAPRVRVNGAGPLIEPEQACQDAIDAGLVLHRAHPLNCQTELGGLIGGVVMPNARFYVRNHFHIPRLDASAWRLVVRGHIRRPLSLTLSELRSMRSHTVVATLECAGNGRTRFLPLTAGEQWRLGAVSTAEWTGVPLAEVLERCRPRTSAREVVFRGGDSGHVPGRREQIRYERSLSLEDAVDSDALLAYAMNGEPLPAHHGHPLRLIVPGWFAMASVKWLAEIELIDREFEGHFQTETYVYGYPDGAREPVSRQNVRSVITEPTAGERRGRGPLTIRGVAWSGEAPIRKVEVSAGGGPWIEASLIGEPTRHGWRWWEVLTRIDHVGAVTLRVRATDDAGRTQPENARWNRMGYGNDAIHEIVVHLR